jgi:hypothetical protein
MLRKHQALSLRSERKTGYRKGRDGSAIDAGACDRSVARHSQKSRYGWVVLVNAGNVNAFWKVMEDIVLIAVIGKGARAVEVFGVIVLAKLF